MTVRMVPWALAGPQTQTLSADGPSRMAVRMLLMPYAAKAFEVHSDLGSVEVAIQITALSRDEGEAET